MTPKAKRGALMRAAPAASLATNLPFPPPSLSLSFLFRIGYRRRMGMEGGREGGIERADEQKERRGPFNFFKCHARRQLF